MAYPSKVRRCCKSVPLEPACVPWQVSKARELRLVQSQHLLEVPNVQLHAQAL